MSCFWWLYFKSGGYMGQKSMKLYWQMSAHLFRLGFFDWLSFLDGLGLFSDFGFNHEFGHFDGLSFLDGLGLFSDFGFDDEFGHFDGFSFFDGLGLFSDFGCVCVSVVCGCFVPVGVLVCLFDCWFVCLFACACL